ncbi:MAG: HD-GYP domain-containing protein [Chloroflexota bacterium]
MPKNTYAAVDPEQEGTAGSDATFLWLSRLSKVVLALAVGAAVALLLIAFPGHLVDTPALLTAAVVFGVVRLASDLSPMYSPRARLAEATVAVDFALLLLVGLGGAVLVAGLAATARTLVEVSRDRAVHPLITIARAVVVIGLAGLVYDFLLGPGPLSWTVTEAPALIAVGLTYVACDVALALIALMPNRRESVAHNWWSAAPRVGVQYASMLGLGALTAVVYHFSPVASFLLALPVGVAQYTLRSAIASRRSIRLAIEALATEIDDRETYTAQHSERCALYARRICQELRVKAQETEMIAGVAKIHDLGKMNIWPEMLNKAGPLDDTERLEMNRHPAYGAEILAGFVNYSYARDIIMHHHERFDGNGYPAGLKGEQIPLGSRIVAVVDAFDAMTSHRPYRRALTFEHAIEELQTNAGRQFDPVVVAAFVATVRPEDLPQPRGRTFVRPVEALRSPVP